MLICICWCAHAGSYILYYMFFFCVVLVFAGLVVRCCGRFSGTFWFAGVVS